MGYQESKTGKGDLPGDSRDQDNAKGPNKRMNAGMFGWEPVWATSTARLDASRGILDFGHSVDLGSGERRVDAQLLQPPVEPSRTDITRVIRNVEETSARRLTEINSL